MKITTQKRLAVLAGLLLLSLLVFATGVQAAQAATGVSPLAATQGRGGLDLRGTSLAATGVSPLAATQGRGGFDAARFARASGAQPASSGTSSTTAWIVSGSAAAVLFVAFLAWAVIRRRRQPGERASAAYCAQHPEDALCATA
jgi:hypothetical protein